MPSSYAFEPDWAWLRERENKLDAYLATRQTDTSRPVVYETLNVMAIEFSDAGELYEAGFWLRRSASPARSFFNALGRMAQEAQRILWRLFVGNSRSPMTEPLHRFRSPVDIHQLLWM